MFGQQRQSSDPTEGTASKADSTPLPNTHQHTTTTKQTSYLSSRQGQSTQGFPTTATPMMEAVCLTLRVVAVPSTQFTAVRVPRQVRERVEHVAPQLYEQDQLADMCHQDSHTLSEWSRIARDQGLIDSAGSPADSNEAEKTSVCALPLWHESPAPRMPAHG